MDGWEGWDFQRFHALFVGAAFLLGLQVFLFHWRAAFSRRSMPATNIMLAIARGDRGWRDMIEQSLKAKLKEYAPGRNG